MTCEGIDLINQCTVMWNVSDCLTYYIYGCISINCTQQMYVHTYLSWYKLQINWMKMQPNFLPDKILQNAQKS